MWKGKEAGDGRRGHTNIEGRERKPSVKGKWERTEQVENLEIVYRELEFPGQYLEPELLCVSRRHKVSATFAEATGGCKPVRVSNVDVGVTEDGNLNGFLLSKHFSEQTPLIQFNFLMHAPYCAVSSVSHFSFLYP